MNIIEIRKSNTCCGNIDKLLLTYVELIGETDKIKDGVKAMQRRGKLTALYRGQLLSLIEDFQKDKL